MKANPRGVGTGLVASGVDKGRVIEWSGPKGANRVRKSSTET